MTNQAKVLIADDDPSILAALRLFLKNEDFSVLTATSPGEVEFYVKSENLDLVLIDLNYQTDTTSGQEGLQLVKTIRSLDPDIGIVCMTGWASVEIAVEVMKAGAGDFIEKPWENERLLTVLHNQIKLKKQQQKNQRLSQENKDLKGDLQDPSSFSQFAKSSAMQTLLNTVEQVAKTDLNIFISGENGTGKSLLARYIHQLSERHANSLVSVNMGAIPENLFESELFGHVKGAFTDAKESRIGRVELAEKGTLFLDEVGNIPMTQQAKLLRLLEERQFERVGSSKTLQADIRVISATNADIQELIANQQFRQDLFYRLNSFVVTIPPLTERKEDIVALARCFVESSARKFNKPVPTLSQQAEMALLQYSWPGNIRELSHTIERATLLAETEISPHHLMLNGSFEKHQGEAADNSPSFDDESSMEEIERKVISERLNKFRGNAVEAAKSLGLSRSAFYRRLEKYDI